MLTKKKIRVFRKYKGDGDAWVRSFWPWNKKAMTAEEWAMLSQLVSEFKLINNGLAADSYKEDVLEKARANCYDEETVEELKKLARER